MVNFKLNDEEVALIQAFRQLTNRQRDMILKAAIGTTSTVEPTITVVPLKLVRSRD